MIKKFTLLGIMSPCLLFLVAMPAGAAVVSTYAFNSGMNCRGVWKLPDTSTGTVSCTATFGEDGDYQPVISSPSYTPNGDGTTTDNVTGLMWVSAGTSTKYTWLQALSNCEGKDYAGHVDWRLPNARELMSIVDYGVTAAPTINTVSFPSTQIWLYWSSTTFAGGTSSAWYVDFSDGFVGYSGKGTRYNVRCVRGGP